MQLIHTLEHSTVPRNLIATVKTGAMPINLYENGQYRWMTFDDKVIQGVMAVNEPQRLVAPVSQLFLLFLLQPKSCYSVLNLGLGTGAVERALHYLNREQLTNITGMTSVELHSEVASCVQQYFHLPNTDIVIADAQDYLNNTSRRFDVILQDICFDNVQDDFLQHRQFWARVIERLSDAGQLIVNVNPYSEEALSNLLKLLRQDFASVILIELTEFKNLIIHACKQACTDIDINGLRVHHAFKAVAPDCSQHIRQLFHIPCQL